MVFSANDVILQQVYQSGYPIFVKSEIRMQKAA